MGILNGHRQLDCMRIHAPEILGPAGCQRHGQGKASCSWHTAARTYPYRFLTGHMPVVIQDSTALHRAGQHSNDTDYNPDPKRNLVLALMLTLVYVGRCGMAVV